MELWARKRVEWYKQSLKGYSSRSLEESSIESKVDYRGATQEAAEVYSISI